VQRPAVTDDERSEAAPEEAFALLGHEIRLAILRAFFDAYGPVDPDSLPGVREERTLSYAELMAATGLEDSGKFNYHLEQLRGVFVEEVEDGYVPTAGAIGLYEAVMANRPTASTPVDFEVDESCPNCGSGLRGRYEQEFLTVECHECDLFWGATYRFPKNGIAARDGEGVYGALYDRMMHHVGLARTGQCPSCAGVTQADLPRERLDGAATPTVELACGTCSWFVTVDVLSALQFDPRVAAALLDLGVPVDESSSMRATERVLPDVTGSVAGDGDADDAPVTITVARDGDDDDDDGSVAEITVSRDLEVRTVDVE